jgi:hypothetical protein
MTMEERGALTACSERSHSLSLSLSTEMRIPGNCEIMVHHNLTDFFMILASKCTTIKQISQANFSALLILQSSLWKLKIKIRPIAQFSCLSRQGEPKVARDVSPGYNAIQTKYKSCRDDR